MASGKSVKIVPFVLPKSVNTSTLALTAMAIFVLTTIYGCARMGHPDGGWYDDTPPSVIYTAPSDRGINVSQKRVTIGFDEFIKIDDPTNNVVVSPPQIEIPEIKASGKKVVIELLDSLKPNTTYTIDFSDAITDNNEGNPMGHYTYSFSTGDHIDTMEVAGTVLDASNLEPIKGILVGLYSDLSDSTITTLPLQRVSRTNGSGRFIIKGVAPGNYRVFALQDMDGNYIYSQKSEMIAFNTDVYTTSCGPDVRQDTIWRDSLRIDNIIRTPYTHFYPDDVVLLAFTETLTDRYLLKTDRSEPDRIGIYFTYGADTLPQLRGLDFDAQEAFVIEASPKNDTIVYWLRDTTLINRDTLTIELTYMATDSTGLLAQRTDTIECNPKIPYERRLKLKEKEYEKWEKQQKKLKKKGRDYDSIMPPPKLEPKISIPSGMSPQQNISIEVPVPLNRLNTNGIHLYAKHDTLWQPARWELTPVKDRLRQYVLRAEWRPNMEYKLEVDSAALEDIQGHVNHPIEKSIRIASEDRFGSLFIDISGLPDYGHPIADTAVVVQLLDSQDNPKYSTRTRGGTAEFYYMKDGKYYLRAFIDRNGNGIWDTGEYATGTQPEDVYYNQRQIECKAKWDVTIKWDLTATPRDKQKPLEITKQKPDKEKERRNRNAQRAEELGIEYNPAKIK